MLGEVNLYSRIYLAYGYTDLRFGIDGLARVVQQHFGLDPFRKGTLFLFCGRRTDRIKGLLWEGLSADFIYPHIFLPLPVFTGFLQKNVQIKIKKCIL